MFNAWPDGRLKYSSCLSLPQGQVCIFSGQLCIYNRREGKIRSYISLPQETCVGVFCLSGSRGPQSTICKPLVGVRDWKQGVGTYVESGWGSRKNWKMSWDLRIAKAPSLIAVNKKEAWPKAASGSGHLRTWKEDAELRLWRPGERPDGTVATEQAEPGYRGQRPQIAAQVLIQHLSSMLGAGYTQSFCYYFVYWWYESTFKRVCTKIWILFNKLEHEATLVPLLCAARELFSAYCMGGSHSLHHPSLSP